MSKSHASWKTRSTKSRGVIGPEAREPGGTGARATPTLIEGAIPITLLQKPGCYRLYIYVCASGRTIELQYIMIYCIIVLPLPAGRLVTRSSSIVLHIDPESLQDLLCLQPD